MDDALTSIASPPIVRSSRLKVARPEQRTGRDLLQALLSEQQDLTAVSRFARHHDEQAAPAQARYYRDLIPLERPGPGQQYAFEVDLDACTGCKACVAACHNLNGLDGGEVWRTVGLLHGGVPEQPTQQTVTTACHHCVDPACLAGCPVQAYEKDPQTGIVRHLDDQCIGCQYCTLMCPYDVPKYSPARGIVRKCDMCSDRLAADEAPACVQGCPNQAIRIRLVEQAEVRQAGEAGRFLPGAPTPEHTLPATVYRSARPSAVDLLAADHHDVNVEHAHPPLVVMLVLTQLSVGALAVGSIAARVHDLPRAGGWWFAQVVAIVAVAFAALGASLFHLGRPAYAFRAVLGLRTSWLSREALGFGLFAKAAAGLAVGSYPGGPPVPALLAPVFRAGGVWEAAALLIGLGSVFCSVMVYAATRRPHWSGVRTGLRFFATTAVLGLSATHALLELHGALASRPGPEGPELIRGLLVGLLAVTTVKLLVEASALRHLHDPGHTLSRRVARLMVGDLRRATVARFVCGGLGGLLLPALALWNGDLRPGAHLLLAAVGLFALLVGELLERRQFFQAAPASRMPGALA